MRMLTENAVSTVKENDKGETLKTLYSRQLSLEDATPGIADVLAHSLARLLRIALANGMEDAVVFFLYFRQMMTGAAQAQVTCQVLAKIDLRF